MTITIDNGNVHALQSDNRWTPMLRGDVYCSPACGGGCKKAAFDRARQRADALARQLGPGWMPHVWENSGWYFDVRKGAATVEHDERGRYEASIRFYIAEDREECISAMADEPRAAVSAAVAVIRARMAALQRALLSVSPSPAEIVDVQATDLARVPPAPAREAAQ